MKFTQKFYDPNKILFFDMDAVYDMNGVIQKWHSPQMRDGVLAQEAPWESDMLHANGVQPCQDGSRLICRYRVLYTGNRYPELASALGRSITCIAESEDGFHWQRPEMGLCDFRGSKANNIIPNPYHCYFMLDPDDPDPQRRYKGLTLLFPEEIKSQTIEESRKGRCFYSVTSPDAITCSEPKRMNGFEETGDTGALSRDDRTGEYLFTTRKRGYWLSDAYPDFYKRPIKKAMPDGRWVALSTSHDFESWSALDNIMVRDGQDELGVDFYVASIFPYGSIYLGFLRRHHFWHGLMDTELVWSHDRIRWNRSWYRRPFVSWGELGDDGWAFCDICEDKPVMRDGLIYMPYETRNHVHAPWGVKDRGREGMDAKMGMATMREDGFVSLEAGRMGGNLITEPIAAAGKTLDINYRTVAGGQLAIRILNSNFNELDGQETLLRGDALAHRLTCDTKPVMPQTADGTIRLRMYLENAALYSFKTG